MTTAAVFVGQGCCKADTACVRPLCVCVCKKRDRDEGACRHRGYKLGPNRTFLCRRAWKTRSRETASGAKQDLTVSLTLLLRPSFFPLLRQFLFYCLPLLGVIPAPRLQSFPLFSPSFLWLLYRATRCATRKLAIYRLRSNRAETLLVKSVLIWFLALDHFFL